MEKYISLRAFFITSGILGGIVVVALTLITLNGQATREELEEKFSRQDVRIAFEESTNNAKSQNELRVPVPSSSLNESDKKTQASIQKPPVKGLHRKGPKGNTLPVIRADGMTPFKAYSKPFSPKDNPAKISLVLVDFGLSKRITDNVIQNMPDNVTFAMSPYADAPQKTLNKAIKSGFETWLSIPMQTRKFPQSDSGPDTLLTRVTMESNRFRLFNVLGVSAGYPGIIVTDTAQFMQSKSNVNNIMGEVKKRGLGFAFAQTENSPVVVNAILERDLPVAQNDVWLDQPPTPAHIQDQLNKLEEKAKTHGRAVAFFHPYPSSRQHVRDWAQELSGKRIQLAPLSYFARN